MKTLQGHITATEKKHIQAILNADLMAGKIGKKNYFLSLENGVYTVKVQQIDRGLVPCAGSELRLSTNTSKFTV